MPTLNLTLPEAQPHSYPIIIQSGLLNDPKVFKSHIQQSQICIVSNSTIADLYLESVKSQFTGTQLLEVILDDGEQYKTMDSVMEILDRLLANHFHRDCVLIALGGGVIGDMAGFAAACYQRGVKFIQIPTTLLAQVDSSVGGKTGVNHPRGKNMIGAFYQPQAVFIDTQTLTTLPSREFSAGLAEVVKYGLINDLDFFIWLESHAQAIMAGDLNILEQLIEHSCSNKARIVEKDEKESGVRALLNLGHTFGHALEALTHYQEWKHGEAVGIGMMMAAHLSHDNGGLSQDDLDRLQQLMKLFNIPTTFSNLSVEAIYQAMFLDKKVEQGELRLVLMSELGQSYIAQGIQEASIKAAIKSAKSD